MYNEPKLAIAPCASESDDAPTATIPEAMWACRKLAEGILASSFSVLFLAPNGEARRLVPVFDDEFPGVSLLSRRVSSRVAEGFARQCAETVAPIWWPADESSSILTARARRWTECVESPSPGTAGIAFPVSVERARSGVVIFVGDDIVLDESRLCETHSRCFALFEDVVRQRPLDSAKAPSVSKRELECLRLTANGLTSDDIADVLGLSVHTANQYLTNSTHKLNAVNRIHAVAKALRCGLID